MASFWYDDALRRLLDNSFNLSSDTLKVTLVTSAYGANKDDQFASAFGTNEITDTGANAFSKGFAGTLRKTLANVVTARDTTNDLAYLDADDVTWAAINGSGASGIVAAFVILKEVTNDAASPLIAYIDSASQLPVTLNGGDFTIQWNASGIIRLTA